MLQALHIQNYAIIDELEIAFDKGLTIITGETGAGKSILMGALSLILGQRADSTVLLDKDRKTVVEGVFFTGKLKEVDEFLTAAELDAQPELLIRREIAPNGKSRAFINDTPVSLTQLQELAGLLVDLHRQFDTLSLSSVDFQMMVLDAMANNLALADAYRTQYLNWTAARKQRIILETQQQEQLREQDYTKFLLDELVEADLKEQELEELEAENRLLNSAEGIQQSLAAVADVLKQQDQPVVQQLKQLSQSLGAFAAQQTDLKELQERLLAAQIELDDIADEAERIAEKIPYDPARIRQIEERLNQGYKLLKKHGFKATAELIELQHQLGQKLNDLEQVGDELVALQQEENKLLFQLTETAARLSAARAKQLTPIEKHVNQLLDRVGMPNARLKIRLDQQQEPGVYGTDTVEFLFDANKSNQFAPIRKVASGGELSRLMLCIKSLVAAKVNLPTMIFDEIDTGISGEASKQVGQIMKEMAATRQVICITHQPQIAGKADRHLLVYKQPKGKTIQTNIRELGIEDRVTAIAQMLSGERPSAIALENAREMIQINTK